MYTNINGLTQTLPRADRFVIVETDSGSVDTFVNGSAYYDDKGRLTVSGWINRRQVATTYKESDVFRVIVLHPAEAGPEDVSS